MNSTNNRHPWDNLFLNNRIGNGSILLNWITQWHAVWSFILSILLILYSYTMVWFLFHEQYQCQLIFYLFYLEWFMLYINILKSLQYVWSRTRMLRRMLIIQLYREIPQHQLEDRYFLRSPPWVPMMLEDRIVVWLVVEIGTVAVVLIWWQWLMDLLHVNCHRMLSTHPVTDWTIYQVVCNTSFRVVEI